VVGHGGVEHPDLGPPRPALEQLFDNLLDISKLDAGQVEVKREIVSVDTVFDRVRSTFSGPAQDKGLRLTVRRSKATLGTDATLLFRVLSNLVSNSLRYTESGGVLVACRRRGNVAKVEVWDTGIGIPAEQHERIFEEFYQLNNPARDRSRGLGLGLATVRRIVQLLGHPLWLRSTVGKGSRFTIEVPIADPSRVQSVAQTIEQKVPNLIGGKLIVVIDDEESVRLGMQSLLESWGCKCIADAAVRQAPPVRIALQRGGPDGTAFFDAVSLALVTIPDVERRQLTIVLSDGRDNASLFDEATLLDLARRTDAVVHTVLPGDLARAQTALTGRLHAIAMLTGGRLTDAPHPRMVGRALIGALEEFRRSYVLRYGLRGVAVEGWHELTVRVRGARYRVRARTGYLGK
jgi:two-component sensor histidine kinase